MQKVKPVVVDAQARPPALRHLASLPPAVRANPNIPEAAADGWLWGLTPSEDLMLVHAVPRPLAAPRPTRLTAVRRPGDTGAVLLGGVDVHGPSTDNLAVEASWDDPDDRSRCPAGRTGRRRSWRSLTAGRGHAGPGDLLTLGVDGPHVRRSRLRARSVQHHARHQLGDTRHRRIEYSFRASTRFREYFHP